MDNTLGNHIKSIRKSKNYTQEYVADALGMTRQRYSRIEKGLSSIGLDVLTMLAKVFNMTVGDITCVLDTATPIELRNSAGVPTSLNDVYEMVDFLYAGKHMYERIHCNSEDK